MQHSLTNILFTYLQADQLTEEQIAGECFIVIQPIKFENQLCMENVAVILV